GSRATGLIGPPRRNAQKHESVRYASLLHVYASGAPGEIRTHDLCLRRAGARNSESARRASRHSEMCVNLLNGLRSNFRDFSECVLTNNANHVDFDSAIRRFESSRPSQQNSLSSSYLVALLFSAAAAF